MSHKNFYLKYLFILVTYKVLHYYCVKSEKLDSDWSIAAFWDSG